MYAQASMESADHEPAGQVVRTRTQLVWLRRDGIVQTQNYDARDADGEMVLMDLACAKENVDAVAVVGAGKRRPVYVDQHVSLPMSREAQQYYASPEIARAATAVAILADNWIGRLLGNFVLRFKKGEIPMRLVENEAEAVLWLRAYL